MRLKYEKGEEVVEKAKKHACDIIEEMIRQAIKDFNDAGSDSFKLVVTIECEKEPDDRLTAGVIHLFALPLRAPLRVVDFAA